LLIFPGKFCISGSTASVSNLIGKISVLAMFTDSPEH
jgi:hypothetical protein